MKLSVNSRLKVILNNAGSRFSKKQDLENKKNKKDMNAFEVVFTTNKVDWCDWIIHWPSASDSFYTFQSIDKRTACARNNNMLASAVNITKYIQLNGLLGIDNTQKEITICFTLVFHGMFGQMQRICQNFIVP